MVNSVHKKYLEIAAEYVKGDDWLAVNTYEDKTEGVTKFPDMRELPLVGVSDNTYQGVYSEHFIEHLTKSQGENFLKEMFRILKPGGVIRTVWPAQEFVTKLLSDEPLTDEEKYFCREYHKIYCVNWTFYPPEYENASERQQIAGALSYQKGEHKYLWGESELIEKLKEIGFVVAKLHEYQQSRIKDFTNIDTQEEIRRIHSSVVEAQKPSTRTDHE